MLKTKIISTRHNPKGSKNSGFSLIELIVTMTIISTLLGIGTFMAFKFLPNIRLKSAARDLYGNMQKARLLSIKNQIPIAIVFDQPDNRYALCTSPGADANWTTLNDNTTDFIVTLADYNSGIAYGHGSLPAGTEIGTTFDDNITYSFGAGTITNVLLFQPTGNGLAGYVYLDHENRDTNVIAVGTHGSGKIVLRRSQGGGTWK